MARFWVCLCLVATAGVASGQEPKRVPNVVVMMADDLGWHDSAPYGSKQARTPNLARIARTGATFTHAFVASPSCAPSRAAMLTGLMPARNGAEANHSAPRADVVTLPAVLRRLGVVVAAFGKVAHYRMADRFGFDHADERHATEVVAQFLKTHDRKKPLCLFVGTHKPHVPWPDNDGYDPAKLTLTPYQVDTPETRAYQAKYLTAVERMDREVGEIFDLIRAELPGDTLFLFVSDHGAQWPFGKWNLYDAGIRVPLVASWPGRLAPDTRVDAMVSLVDFLPTLAELFGGAQDANLDGRSFAKVLRGESATHRDTIFATHTNDNRFNVYPIRALRTRTHSYLLNLHADWAHTTHVDLAQPKDGLGYWSSWKALAKSDAGAAALVKRYHERPREELYDVVADPWQLKNLASDPAHAKTLESLRAQLAEWRRTQNDEGRVLVDPHLLAKPESWATPLKVTPKKKAKA